MRRLSLILLAITTTTYAATISVDIPKPAPTGLVKQTPAGVSAKQGTLAWDAASLLRNGKPWLPVMGEFHYSRYPNAEWRDELLKMKAGGITMISTYIFWIHHEEEQGKFTWDGDKDLHKFIETCKDVGLPVIVRVGPWCHGEVRNGGFPDWVQAMPRKRTNDPTYLAAVKTYYDQIGQQLKGLYWKNDGPIIGIQFENEFKGPAAHLVTLKQYGLDAGMDVPLYTRTAWDNATNVPTFGEVLPLWGGYAEGFWDRTLDTMPGNYWQVFQFMRDRAPGNAMGADPNAVAQAAERGEVLAYPYLTCELGGGMMSSYHRRIDIAPMDVYSVALTKVGSGSNMPGYYMFHGGTNPEGKLSTLMEAQGPPQNMWNDMPIKNYDFGACLGAAGEVRDSYHMARTLHLFLNDWGEQLARMPATLGTPARNKQDSTTLRYSVRSDGNSGFLFVNNYQRAQDMPAKLEQQFKISLPGGKTVTIPDNGAENIPANAAFIWPFNMDLGGVNLEYVAAQPLCKIKDGDTTYTVFAQTPGVPSDFVFHDKGAVIDEGGVGVLANIEAPFVIHNVKPNTFIRAHSADGRKQVIYLVSDADAKTVWKGAISGKEHLFFSNQELSFDSKSVSLRRPLSQQIDRALSYMTAIPPLVEPVSTGAPINVTMQNGMQTIVFTTVQGATTFAATVEPLKPVGTLRTIPMGSQKVATEPTDADFDNAATFKITLPPEAAAAARKVTLRLHYTGDVARIYLGDRFILDDFYHGQPLDLALWRYPAEELAKGIIVKILPLQKGAPIYIAKWPDFEGPSVAKIDSAELVEERTITVTAK